MGNSLVAIAEAVSHDTACWNGCCFIALSICICICICICTRVMNTLGGVTVTVTVTVSASVRSVCIRCRYFALFGGEDAQNVQLFLHIVIDAMSCHTDICLHQQLIAYLNGN